MDQGRFKNNRRETVERSEVLLSRRQQQRALNKSRLRRRLKISAAVAAVIILFFFSPLFHLRELELTGFTHGDTTALRQQAAAQLGRHFLFVDKAALVRTMKQDPYIAEAEITASITGRLTLAAREYTRDYALVHGGEVFTLDRHGRILERGIVLPAQVPVLVDDTQPLTPGATMYGEGVKGQFLEAFGNLMAQNTSTIRFDRVDITDPARIRLDHGDWSVELGDGADLKNRLNQAINILKAIPPEDEPGIIDLRFDAPPVIRAKGANQ